MSSQKLDLSQQQQEVFEKITTEKKNIFFTGCAGTGKSFLIKHIIQYYHTTLGSEYLAVTASTGRAAFSIGGSTLHSFAGVGLGNEDISNLIKKVNFNKKILKRWKDVKVLIIDEISMLSADYFDKLEYIAKKTRNSTLPFGGIQLIITGDLLQLPPVSEGGVKRKRIFESESWNSCIDEYIVLYEVFRQSDIKFAEVLTYIRLGAMNDEVNEFIENLSREKVYDSESGPVNLYSTRAKADEYNKQHLDAIDGSVKEYVALDKYKSRSNHSTVLDSCPAVPLLELKIGSQVMLVKNINKDLVNGTVGTIINFTEVSENATIKNIGLQVESLPIVRFDLADGRLYTRVITREVWSQTLPTGEEIASRRQIPLILAWAVTIHKSQGQSIQRLKVDLQDVFESGQVYTALSRAVSPDTLEVVGFDASKVVVDQDSLKFCIDNNLI